VLRAEFTIEPFVEGAPGPHVTAALEVAREASLPTDFGPFGTSFEGEDDRVLTAIDAIARKALALGATRLSIQLSRSRSAETLR
jgi:uncharacterized protein YqgV (UPF0045/DUF77 family)